MRLICMFLVILFKFEISASWLDLKLIFSDIRKKYIFFFGTENPESSMSY